MILDSQPNLCIVQEPRADLHGPKPSSGGCTRENTVKQYCMRSGSNADHQASAIHSASYVTAERMWHHQYLGDDNKL